MMSSEDPGSGFDRLIPLDPSMAATLGSAFRQARPRAGSGVRDMVADLVLWGVALHPSLGPPLVDAVVRILSAGRAGRLPDFISIVREKGGHGPGVGRIVAVSAAAVTAHGDAALLKRYEQVLDIMSPRGTTVIGDTFDLLNDLLAAGDRAAAGAYLNVLATVFSRPLTYNRSVYLSKHVPREVRRLPPDQRAGLLSLVNTVAGVDDRLVDVFFEGYANGGALLEAQAYSRFVRRALDVYRRRPQWGILFLAMRSRDSRDTALAMQQSVPLAAVAARLNRYVRAHLGPQVSVAPQGTGEPSDPRAPGLTVFTDGRTIFLPERMSWHRNRSHNADLYMCLVRLEMGVIAGGSYLFDLERLYRLNPDVRAERFPAAADLTDMQRFFLGFEQPGLARDLFTAFEHGRLLLRQWQQYPGMAGWMQPHFKTAAARIDPERRCHPLFPLYLAVGMGMDDAAIRRLPLPWSSFSEAAVRDFRQHTDAGHPVEASALMTLRHYPAAVFACRDMADGDGPDHYRPPVSPLGRLLRPDRFAAAHRVPLNLTAAIADRLRAEGYGVDRRAIMERLVAENGRLTGEDLVRLVVRSRGAAPAPDAGRFDAMMERFFNRMHGDGGRAVHAAVDTDDGAPAVWYKEWDRSQGDYLMDHVRLREVAADEAPSPFYEDTVSRHYHTIRRIRRAFEMIRPQGMALLRRWMEGDEFDYRALLDAVIDRRAGVTPSSRVYTKRLKHVRDVAVLLLVDLSRSTAHPAAGKPYSVMEMEKAAIVLFCEALDAVGDRYAIAGFSGTGRLGVDYYRIKAFDGAADDGVRNRIGRMRPRRNTRMGAAVRHAAADLEPVPSAVKLLIVVGDGFPNDVDYKHDYAISDTRRSVLEANARGIGVHGITVNIAGDPRLDELYGRSRHSVISDVGELPAQLWRIYSHLTAP